MDGIARFQTPQAEVFCLTDGGTDFGAEVFPAVDAQTLATRLQAAGHSTIRTQFNAFLIRQGQSLTLVDTGCGTLFGPAGGQLPARLAALDVAPADIGTLVFTHLHGDHCGGALLDGVPVYPHARVVMHPAEHAHWQDRDAPAARVIAAYADRIQTATGGQEVAPSVTVWDLPGHTPGHIGLRIGTGVVIVGDIFHSSALQLPDPEVATIYDVDAAMATQTRKDALAAIAARDQVFTGGHAVAPHCFARLATEGAGYRTVGI
ncbi:MBL fold metallo-hydrolase [Seohaeicola sp. SP36]|nr:MBL fold metallo-hydrolase [Seohaeicola sp. SP36]MDD9709347.1 MBL fold metallo-hydrolase [Seohaeicola sp. 4SK31]